MSYGITLERSEHGGNAFFLANLVVSGFGARGLHPGSGHDGALHLVPPSPAEVTSTRAASRVAERTDPHRERHPRRSGCESYPDRLVGRAGPARPGRAG